MLAQPDSTPKASAMQVTDGAVLFESLESLESFESFESFDSP
jgi:hypothetical protein